MKKISLYIIVSLFGLLSLNSCVDDDYSDPIFETPEFTVPDGGIVKTIAELKKIYRDANPTASNPIMNADLFQVINEDIYVSGFVVSNDEFGNFYKNIVIQGELDGSSEGINISIGESDLNAKFAIGQKVFVKCKGLTLGLYGNNVQIGGGNYWYKFKEFRLAPILSPAISEHIFKDGVIQNVPVKNVTIDNLSDDDRFTLITLENVQFKGADAGTTWGNVEGDHSEVFPFKSTLVEDENGNTLTVFTSNYSDFGSKLTPTGSGTITGVLSAHNGESQLVINSLSDVDMDEDRFGASSGKNDYVDSNAPTVTKTIADLNALYSGSIGTISTNFVIEGTVISNQGESGNFYNQVYIQDATGGIQLRSYKSKFLDGLALGQKVVINASNMKIGEYKGVTQIGVDFNGGVGGLGDTDAKAKVFRNGANNNLAANTIKISEVNNAAISTLVRFDEIQFIDADTGKTLANKSGDFKFSENRTITDKDGNTIVVRTANTSSFADFTISNKSGSITGVLSKFDSTWQLLIRKTSDIELASTRF